MHWPPHVTGLGRVVADLHPAAVAIAGVGVKTLYITPGSPWENGYSESFNGSLCDELNGEIFYSLAEAKVLIEAWRRHYSTVCPYSAWVIGAGSRNGETAIPASDSATLHLRPEMAAMGLLH